MNDDYQSLKFNLVVQASARAAYQAFTHAAVIQEWLCDGALADPQPGGRIYFTWRSGYAVTGHFTRLDAQQKVTFTWHGYGEPEPSEVKVSFLPHEDDLEINLVHGNIGLSKAGKKQAKEFEKGWLKSLENLKTLLETGQDLRLVNRPFIGVYGLEQVTPENAERLGLTIHRGMRIVGVVEGAPAHAAGLLKDDVITRMDGERVDSYQLFDKFIATHQAGDAIKVVFHRQGEKMSAFMELGKRPAPDLPEQPDQLKSSIQKAYQDNQQTLNQILVQIKESEAVFRVDPQSWNVKEVLAHLIAEERDVQTWMSGVLEGRSEVYEITTRANHPERLSALINAGPRCRSLLSALRRAQKETLGLLEFVLPRLVERKGTYVRLSNYMHILARHGSEHVQQITTCVQQARQAAPQAK